MYRRFLLKEDLQLELEELITNTYKNEIILLLLLLFVVVKHSH